MPATYIDTDDVDAVLDSDTRQDLFTPVGGAYTASYFDRSVQLASELVKAAASNAGYTLGDTTTNETVKLATLGQLLGFAYARRQLELPAQFWGLINLSEAIRTGDVPLVGLTPSESAAVGGSGFSTTDSTVTGSREQVFSRSELDVY